MVVRARQCLRDSNNPYNHTDEVIAATELAGINKPVARFTPIGNVKERIVILSEVKRSGTKSKNPVKLPLGLSAGFDFAHSRSLSLRPSRLCRNFPGCSILDFATVRSG